jgi:hypothetical protein
MNPTSHNKAIDQPTMIIAGPCSIDRDNFKEIFEIAGITVLDKHGQKQRAVYGTRVVGMKSRTELSHDGKGMGIDYEVYRENLKKHLACASPKDYVCPPSVEMAVEIHEDTGLLIATEVMSPLLQLSAYEKRISPKKLMAWVPAVNQLGWPVLEMAAYAAAHEWYVGIKNGKWLGEPYAHAESDTMKNATAMEKTWIGLAKYAQANEPRNFLIQRGVDIPRKGDYRNLPVHNAARRAKTATGCRMLYDPSHIHGPKLRHHIVSATIDAMHITMPDGSYLYDGLLIEAGTSQTDTHQHITLAELRELCTELAKFRTLMSPVS